MEEKEYDLEKSLKGKYGQLVPCLANANGKVFDGLHRLQHNPKAEVIRRDQVKTPVDERFARLIVNHNRRRYSSEEMRDDVGFLIGCGFSIAQISEITGISEPTLYRHQPQELKDEKKVEAGVIGGAKLAEKSALTREQTVKTSDMLRNSSQPKPEEQVECERCHVHSGDCKPWHGHQLCEGCFKKAEFNPEAYDGYFKYLERAKNHQVPPKLLPQKPQETWQQRKAVMQPQKSKQEMDLLEELSNRGITPETDKWICLWGTKPDGDYPEKKIVYYVHGEPHDKGKALDRDDEIRAALEKDGWTVFVFRHDEGNVKEWADKIEEALKW
jgi:hypothetical protein